MNNDIIIKLVGHSGNLKDSIQDATGSLEGMIKAVTGSTGSWTGLAVGAGAAGAALYGLAQMTANYGDHLLELSDKTGMTVEDLSLLKFAAEQSNTSIEAISESSKFLNKNLTDAASGNEKAATAFKALGLNVGELMKMPIKDRFLAMADAVSSVQDPGLRASLAIDTMGRSAAEMLPMMKEGASGIRELMGEADSLGLKMSGETAKQADEFNDSLARLWTVVKQVGYDVGGLLLPPLQFLFDLLVNLAGFIKNTFYAVAHGMNTMILGLAGAVVFLLDGLARATDALHLTTDAAKKTSEWNATLAAMTKEALKSTLEYGTKAVDSLTGTAEAQEEVNDGARENINLTDEQRLAVLNKSKTEKEAAEAEKARLKEVNQSIKEYQDELDHILDYKKSIKKFDDEYFTAYANKLRMTGQNEERIAEMVTAEKKRLKADELQTVITVENLKEQAAKGVATAIKLLWSDNTVSFKDAWTGALNTFVDVVVQMAIQGKMAATSIQLDMAAATAGISLLIGLIASVLTNRGGSQSALQKATEEFLRDLRTSLRAFEDEIMSSMEKLARNVKDGMTALADTYELIGRIMKAAEDVANTTGQVKALNASYLADLRTELVGKLPEIKDAIIERYNLEKSLINEVFALLNRQKNFVRDIDKTIQDVTRSTFTKDELFAAQKGDVQTLLAAIGGTSGEDRVSMANDLKQAYLAYFETAKDLFSGSALAAIQQEVLAGLQNVKGYGVSGFDQLIDINLQMLGVQRTGADLQAQMVNHLDYLEKQVERSFWALEKIATADSAGLPMLFAILSDAMSRLGFEIPAMASGGVVTKATIAMIGEGGETEIVSPVSKMREIIRQEMGGGMGGGIGTLQVILPNVKDARDLTERDWMEVLKKFRFATKRMGENGYSLGMA
ncbi:MAG: hypothetical protein OEW15_18565 [Nitrospirota bacterium]|nr:hypothetical protein [Nitrospirota bacterium]